MSATRNIDRSRDLSIDSLRGLAILLMVAGHVIGGNSSRGLQVNDDSWWRYYYIIFADVRMPLFTVLSGYIYSLRPVTTKHQLPQLLKGKIRRLVVPLFTIGTIFFYAQLIIPGTNRKPDPSELWTVYVYGIEYLWFIQAIFILFLVIGCLDAFSLLVTGRQWIITITASCLFYAYIEVPTQWDIYSLNGAIDLAPFFLLGIGIHRFSDQMTKAPCLATFASVALIAFSFRIIITITHQPLDDFWNRTLSLIVGMSSTWTIFMARRYLNNTALARIGIYAFGIYLLHTFGNAGTRLALNQLGVDNVGAQFFVCLIAAIALPIVFERALGSNRFISWGFLGQKPRIRKKVPQT